MCHYFITLRSYIKDGQGQGNRGVGYQGVPYTTLNDIGARRISIFRVRTLILNYEYVTNAIATFKVMVTMSLNHTLVYHK